MEKDKTYIHFLVDKDFKEILQKEAKKRQLTLNSYIRLILLARNGK